jgi:putative ABC transport system permease protein
MRTAWPSRLLLWAGIRYFRQHRWQAFLALSGVMLGVAIVVAVDLANTASRQAFADAAATLRGDATHRIVNPAGDVAQEVYRRLATTPDHPPMAPIIEARVGIEGYPGRARLIGLDFFAEAGFRGMLGNVIQGRAAVTDWLSRPGAAIVSRSAAAAFGVRSGEHLNADFHGNTSRLRVLGIYDDDSGATSDLILVDIATAQAISGKPDEISYIDLALSEAGRVWVAQRLPDNLMLVDARDQADGIAAMSASFELNLTAMSLLALLVGLFLIYNAMSFSVVQRRTLLGRLRALGVTATEIQRVVLFEALLVALIGSLVGILLGMALGYGLLDVVTTTVSSLYYQTQTAELTLPASTLTKGTLLGIGGTLLAAWIPARTAAATPPLTTLSRTALETRARGRLPISTMGGISLVGVGVFVAMQVPGGVVVGFAGLFLLLIGAAAATPMSLRLPSRLAELIGPSNFVRMALRDFDRHLSRLGTAIAALMITLAAGIGVAVMVESMRGSVGIWLDSLLTADVYVSSAAFADGAPLPPGLDNIVSTVPGVGGITRYRDRILTVDNRPLMLVAADLDSRSREGFRFAEREPEDVWQDYVAGQVLISEPLAYHRRLSQGDTLDLPTAFGSKRFRVAGVFQDYASERGRVFIDLATYRQHWSDVRIDTLALFAADGSASGLIDSVRSRLSADHDLAFTAAGEIHDESLRIFDRTFRITEVLRYLLLLVAFIGVFSALMAIQLERRREFAVMRAIGFSGWQIAQLIAMQATLLGLLAGMIAIPTGLVMAWILTDAVQQRAFGWTMQYLVPLTPLITSIGLGVVAALLASAYPAWQSARSQPAQALRED